MCDSFALPSSTSVPLQWSELQHQGARLYLQAERNIPPGELPQQNSPEWYRLTELLQGDTSLTSKFMQPILKTFQALRQYRAKCPGSSNVPVLTHNLESAVDLMRILSTCNHKVSCVCQNTATLVDSHSIHKQSLLIHLVLALPAFQMPCFCL